MQAPDMTPSPRYEALYRATVQEAAKRGAGIMARLIALGRSTLQARAGNLRDTRLRDVLADAYMRDMSARDALAEASQLLMKHERDLCERYPKALLAAFENPQAVRKAVDSSATVIHFDELELMDEGQVQASVTMAKAQHDVMLTADASLAEFNTFLCSSLGLSVVKPERNPMRPEVYLATLKEVIENTPVKQFHRTEWFTVMNVELGKELSKLYDALSANLREKNVVPAGFAVVLTPGAAVGGGGRLAGEAGHRSPPEGGQSPFPPHRSPGAADPAGSHSSGAQALSPVGEDALLTLDKLRSLLSGELDLQLGSNHVRDFAQQFDRQFESAPVHIDNVVSEFEVTVPAAFEALTEMNQASQVVSRLEQRSAGMPAQPGGDQSVGGLRDFLRRSATGAAQALSLEVVTLMVENIVRDPQLLEPVRELIRDLESPLLLLALVDPRFFTDKQHPARELLQEIAHRSMAFESEHSSGFADFVVEVKKSIAPLQQATIDNAEPFERALAGLLRLWRQEAKRKDLARETAVKALQHAEQRNLLAEKIAKKIMAHPDAISVSPIVLEFLCGPWSQVVAQARLVGGSDSSAADKYQAMISAMLWSAHPKLTRKNVAKLTRLVPLLLSTVREGAQTINYSATKIAAFLDVLMGLHQLAFRPAAKPAEASEPPEPEPISTPPLDAMAPLHAHLLEDRDPWVAPQEAEDSNFMEMPELNSATDNEGSQPSADHAGSVECTVAQELPLGSWIELLVNDKWVRTQLTWASPHGTLFLFTSVLGTTQSMTRRSRDKLVAMGAMRIVSTQTVVDGALDAVAQIAMRNSIDISL